MPPERRLVAWAEVLRRTVNGKPAVAGARSNQVDSIWQKNTNYEIYKEWMLGYISLTP